ASYAAFSACDYNAALTALQCTPSQTHNKAQLIQVYQQLANSAATVGKVKDALHYYDLKHQLDPSSARQDAYIMGQLYEREGNNAKALQQYQVALAYYKAQPNADQMWSQTSEIQGKIDVLKGAK
ncbi:MAG TPA: hypothetical protein VKQ34_00895, partial [Candidatus Saccharimonadales bacterium]|nr:hypothetical protein [Candidatus Saccharimonadales bacterium]